MLVFFFLFQFGSIRICFLDLFSVLQPALLVSNQIRIGIKLSVQSPSVFSLFFFLFVPVHPRSCTWFLQTSASKASEETTHTCEKKMAKIQAYVHLCGKKKGAKITSLARDHIQIWLIVARNIASQAPETVCIIVARNIVDYITILFDRMSLIMTC
jgi:hypothetical protein